jgi:hypothetical protein
LAFQYRERLQSFLVTSLLDPGDVSFEHEDDESLAIKVFASHKTAQPAENNRLDQ